MLTIIINAFEETLTMVLISGALTLLFGLPLGFLLYCSTNKQFISNKLLHYFLRIPIILLNTTPYIIITILSIPLLNALTSNHNPITIAILPLTIATIPFFSTLIFEAIKQLPVELTEVSKTMGATPWQSITKFYFPEVLPAVIFAIAKTLMQLISYSTIAGLFGAGGIGELIMKKGYYSFEIDYVVACALILTATALFIQFSSRLLAKQIAKQ